MSSPTPFLIPIFLPELIPVPKGPCGTGLAPQQVTGGTRKDRWDMGRKESSSLPSQCKNEPKDVWGHPAGRDGELPMCVLIPVSPQPPSLCVTRPGGGSQGSHWRGETEQDPFPSLFSLSLPSCRDRHCCWKSSKVTAKEFAFPELGFMRPERALALGPAASPQPGEFVWTPCRKM